MNNLLAPIYEMFFDWNAYQELLAAVYNNFDYGKIGLILLIVPPIVLIIFYRVWDPMRSQILKLVLSVVLILIISYSATSAILYSNIDIVQYIGDFIGGDGQPDGHYFIFQMSIYTVLISLLPSGLFSFLFRFISINNSHNPF